MNKNRMHYADAAGIVSKKPCFVAWAGGVAEGSNITVPSALAAALGLASGTIVHVHAVPNVPAAASVTVEPLAASDWEVLELNAGLLEDQMLHQVPRCILQQDASWLDRLRWLA
jgi:hypothetical protein